MTQLSSAAAEKEKAFFEEIKIANQRFQSTNNELTRLSVNFEQSKSESQAFQAERDKLVQDNGRLAQSEAAHELKVHSLELAKQRTKLEDACKHYQNTLKDEQGKLQLKDEELGAANSEISRIKSEVAAKTDAVEGQNALVMELQQDVTKREVTTYGSLLWDSLMRSMPGDGKATVTRYQGLGKAKQ